VARLESPESVERLVIVRDGPRRNELAELALHLGIAERVELPGAVPHNRVREALESADLFAMPCVVAADGDRDSLPVVTTEAMAMEIPIVASREVGLPEVVRDEWGRLVPPRDSEALAQAIAEMLALPAEERARMGAAAREFVEREFDPDDQARKLFALIRPKA
jgi:glycosyltransferase involved in cell wall biosynthesis